VEEWWQIYSGRPWIDYYIDWSGGGGEWKISGGGECDARWAYRGRWPSPYSRNRKQPSLKVGAPLDGCRACCGCLAVRSFGAGSLGRPGWLVLAWVDQSPSKGLAPTCSPRVESGG
jgi:hypothetical protein